MRTEDECGWEGVTGRSCGDSGLQVSKNEGEQVEQR